MSDALPLPPRPDLEQYKKLAKDFQDACQSTDSTAIHQWAARWLETLARLQGLAGASYAYQPKRIAERWEKLALECKLSNAQFFIAREHGFLSWARFASHVRSLARADSPVSAFEAAADAIISGNAETLKMLLARHPGLVIDRSSREHRSTLLHYISANGVEDFRQKTPKNILEIAKMLLDAGAKVDAESDAYGGGCTALGLVATSVHPQAAGVQIPLLKTLLDRGSSFDKAAAGHGHPIVWACFANGQPEAARFLADRGASLNLASAAALGRLDVLRTYFAGSTQPEMKQMEEALIYASGYGSATAAEFLLTHGVDPAARNRDGQTALHWANYGAHVDVIRLLLKHGGPVDAKDNRFHATPLDSALWRWETARSEEERERCYEAVALMAQAGAKLDADHWREGSADNPSLLEKIAADPRMRAALVGAGNKSSADLVSNESTFFNKTADK